MVELKLTFAVESSCTGVASQHVVPSVSGTSAQFYPFFLICNLSIVRQLCSCITKDVHFENFLVTDANS